MSEPKLSVMLFPFHSGLSDGTLSAAPVLREFREAGIAALEPMLFPEGSQPNWWGEFERAAADMGMPHVCCDVGVDLVGENEAARRAALDVVARGVEWCAGHGCPLALLAGSRPAAGASDAPSGSGMSDADGRKVMAEALAAAADSAKGSGVTLTIEDFGVYPAFTCSAAHVLEVIQASGRPDLVVTFDNGNFLFADEKPSDCFGLLESRMGHVHIKDFALGAPGQPGGLDSLSGRRYVGCPIGDGHAEVKECLDLLRGIRYAGWLSLEVGMAPPVEDALRGARVVRDLWVRSE